jgi:hypothetical protein
LFFGAVKTHCKFLWFFTDGPEKVEGGRVRHPDSAEFGETLGPRLEKYIKFAI